MTERPGPQTDLSRGRIRGAEPPFLDVGENNLRNSKDLGFGLLSHRGRLRLSKASGRLGGTRGSGVQSTWIQTRPTIYQNHKGLESEPLGLVPASVN